jgi:hypothetical protein
MLLSIPLAISPPLINNPNLPLVSNQEESSFGSGNFSGLYTDLDFSGTTGLLDGVDDTTAGGTDGNNYTYGGNVTGSTTKTINLFIAGGQNVSFTFNDNDADTDTFQQNYSDYLITRNYTTNGTFYLASNPSGYITDGNTNWDNSYSFTTNESCSAFINLTGLIINWSLIPIVENDTLQTVMTRGNTTAKYMTITDTGSGRIDGAGYLSIFNNGSGNTEFALALKQQNTDYNAQYIWYNGSDFALGIDNWGYDGTETGGILVDSWNQSDYGILTRVNTGSSGVPLVIENDGSGNDITAPNMTLNDGVLILGSSTFSGTKYISIGNSTKYLRFATTPTTTVISTLDSLLEIKGATGAVYFNSPSVNNVLRLRNSSGTDSSITPTNGGFTLSGNVSANSFSGSGVLLTGIPTNASALAYANSSGLIKDWNATGYIKNWGSIADTDTWNTTEEMQDAVGNGLNITLKYDDANNQIGVNQTWLGDTITNYNYITDGNTNWDNSYSLTTNESALQYVNSTGHIKDWNATGLIRDDNSTGLIRNWSTTPIVDTDTWNTTEEMQDAVGGGLNTTLRYDDANNQIGVNQTWLGDKITSYGYITDANTSGLIRDWNSTGLIKDDNSTGLIKDYTGFGYITWNNAVNGTLALASSLSSYVLTTNLVNLVGNWTLDKVNYFTKTEVINLNYVNTTTATNLNNRITLDGSNITTPTNLNNKITINCANITGGSDGNYCVDDAAAGGGNPFDQVLNESSNVTFNEIYINTTTELSNNHSLFSIDTNGIYETQRGYLFVIDDDPNTGGTGEGYFAIYNNPTGNTVVYGANNGGGYADPLDPSTDSIAVAHMFTDDWGTSKTTPTYGYRSQIAAGLSNVFRILTKTDYMYFGDSDNSSVINIYFNSTNATFSGDLNASKTISSPTLAVSSCDVKAHSGNGTIYCGTDVTGSGGGLTEWINKTIANVNTTNNVAYSNLTGLRTTLSANTNYSVDCVIIDRSSIATTGIQLRINSSGTPTEVTWVFGSTISATAYTTVQGVSTSQNALADTGSSGSNIRANSQLTGYIQTGANPVVLDYDMKAEVSASWAMVDKGSTCRYTVIT